jgi:hypothetical protein
VTRCSITDCERPVNARGWCSMHYYRWRMHGDPHTVQVRVRADCRADGCGKSAWAQGLCPMHLSRWKRHGSLLLPSAAGRFWRRVDKDGPVPEHRLDLGPCWLWTGAKIKHGYGKWWPGGESPHLAHRYSYRLVIGEISDETPVLDHLCRTPSCVRPAHLEPVTSAEYSRRQSLFMARRTHCPQGHEFTPENTIQTSRQRRCRRCKNDYERRVYWTRKRDETQPPMTDMEQSYGI